MSRLRRFHSSTCPPLRDSCLSSSGEGETRGYRESSHYLVSSAGLSRRLPSPLKDALGAFEFAPAAGREPSAAAVDEVLNHANGRPEPFRRDVLPCHRPGD